MVELIVKENILVEKNLLFLHLNLEKQFGKLLTFHVQIDKIRTGLFLANVALLSLKDSCQNVFEDFIANELRLFLIDDLS